MTPLLGITMKDFTSASTNSSCPTPAWIGSLPPRAASGPLWPRAGGGAMFVREEQRAWKLAEGIPSHEAPALSITFQLANEPDH